jgi:hypothetical protein
MSIITENIDNLSDEEVLGPPKYDAIGIFMVFLSTLITGVITWVVVILLAYFAIGKFSLESWASPLLLVFITFIALTIGNILYYTLMSYIFPHIYSRGRTSISQITWMSMVLYVLFIPIYLIMSGISTETPTILIAFSAHVILNNFSLTLIVGLVAQYRYALLTFYAGTIALIITTCVVVLVQTKFWDSNSSKALFVLLGLTILTYTLSGTLSSLISWIYYRLYQASWFDPIGSVFSQIENDEKEIERRATEQLTHFHK